MLLHQKLALQHLILGSQSPRRKELLSIIYPRFTIVIENVDESFPATMEPSKVPEFIAQKKAAAYNHHMERNTVLICADTIVCIGRTILNKPDDRSHAVAMLTQISGCNHTVYTGVCIRSMDKLVSFTVSSNVFFKHLTHEEIEYYVDNFKPFDKAGAYGVQDWIGAIGIEKIEGSFHNVMGLPVKELYEQLLIF